MTVWDSPMKIIFAFCVKRRRGWEWKLQRYLPPKR